VATITNSQCRRSDYYEEQVTENMICAEPTDGRDACSGFGGGPLAVQAQDGSYSQIGILSFGRGCANKGYPGVYTRVTSFLDWIQETITITPGGQVIMISGGLTEGSVGLSSVEIYDPSAPSVKPVLSNNSQHANQQISDCSSRIIGLRRLEWSSSGLY